MFLTSTILFNNLWLRFLQILRLCLRYQSLLLVIFLLKLTLLLLRIDRSLVAEAVENTEEERGPAQHLQPGYQS